jgi:hypothetical protein
MMFLPRRELANLSERDSPFERPSIGVLARCAVCQLRASSTLKLSDSIRRARSNHWPPFKVLNSNEFAKLSALPFFWKKKKVAKQVLFPRGQWAVLMAIFQSAIWPKVWLCFPLRVGIYRNRCKYMQNAFVSFMLVLPRPKALLSRGVAL